MNNDEEYNFMQIGKMHKLSIDIYLQDNPVYFPWNILTFWQYAYTSLKSIVKVKNTKSAPDHNKSEAAGTLYFQQ